MAKTIEGTKARRTTQVVKGQTNTRQMRCKRCNNLTQEVSDGKGGLKTKCPQCGVEYKVTSI